MMTNRIFTMNDKPTQSENKNKRIAELDMPFSWKKKQGMLHLLLWGPPTNNDVVNNNYKYYWCYNHDYCTSTECPEHCLVDIVLTSLHNYDNYYYTAVEDHGNYWMTCVADPGYCSGLMIQTMTTTVISM